MARGSPDWTVLSEQSFAHYTDRVERQAAIAVSATPVWDEVLNVDIRGVWGYMWAWSDSRVFRPRITIDGVIVFMMTINELAGGGFWGYSQPWKKFGCTMFNNVAGDLNFGMFYDEQWGLYIHENLTIEVQRAGALGTQASWGIYYKELTE